ncbi:M2 family metallopeptidase [Thermoflavimicrobium dichotomicum]|uniref:Peptidyl-dipeptidase A n=1 Tax=Thermoflavimicrobium dichotomicum TaxID=46223 RepID=A0A1I3L6L8_9BACL|nr:M2 family metallopeptidase [Thermoflavimicrobium dichotomicum]SFI80423.1 peptidyl-dipeptidase A [Thermoflavimicrobium dichotomicum]
MEDFLRQENEKIASIFREWMQASWMVNTTGEKEWQEKEARAEAEYRHYCSNPERFKQIQHGLQTAEPNSLEHRQYQRLYQDALANQLPKDMLEKMVQLSSELSNIFNTFRGEMDGRKISENEIRDILVNSVDQKKRKKAWEASKQIAQKVTPGLLQLIQLRNEAARKLGYEDHHQMAFELNELDRDEIYGIFQRLKELTDEPFRKIKSEIDQELAERYGIKVSELRPWHYLDPFFQEAPPIPGTDISAYFQNKNIEQLTADTFRALGMDITDLLANSDLYERERKNQHAFCIDMDREGDVRVLCNIRNNQYWMETMLHEFGHAVYDKYNDPSLPFILRTHAHIFTTEAVAMFFGRMVKNREWLHTFLGLDDQTLDRIMPNVEKMLQRQMLITARWVITFVFFERELYRNPDQDLNRLWWKFVSEIQYVHPPEKTDYPHWAAKIHFTIAPVYYQNYLLGELTASQFDQYIRNHISPSIFNQEVGKFFIEKVFKPGDRYGWEGMIERATGEPLNPEHFVKQFVK